LKLAITCDASNGEAFNNLGVIGRPSRAIARMDVWQRGVTPGAPAWRTEHRSDNVDAARAHYLKAIDNSAYIHEPHFNFALVSFNSGDMAKAQQEVRRCSTFARAGVRGCVICLGWVFLRPPAP
jgi:hypothetical protein